MASSFSRCRVRGGRRGSRSAAAEERRKRKLARGPYFILGRSASRDGRRITVYLVGRYDAIGRFRPIGHEWLIRSDAEKWLDDRRRLGDWAARGVPPERPG